MPSAYDRLPLGALRVFEAVATHLSFSAAADALNVTPAAVSQQIKTLEGYIQVPLFRRSGRRVEITEEGCELLPAVRAGSRKARVGPAADQASPPRRTAADHAAVLVPADLAAAADPLVSPQVSRHRTALSHLARTGGFLAQHHHVAIRFGRGNYPNLHSENLLDDWLVPVASPDLIKQYGMIERGADSSKFPLLEGDDEPWSVWAQARRRPPGTRARPASMTPPACSRPRKRDLGYRARHAGPWCTRALQKGTLKLAGNGRVPYGSAYYFVCPQAFSRCPRWRSFAIGCSRGRAAFPGPSAGREGMRTCIAQLSALAAALLIGSACAKRGRVTAHRCA